MNIWNEIVQLCNGNRFSPEETLQKMWQDIFSDFFDYKKLRKEIDSKRSIQIGSSKHIIPDIILRDGSKDCDRCIIELKQQSINLLSNKDINAKNQLFSYMKQLGLDVGIVICDKIHVFYLTDLRKEESISIEIPFEKDNINGQRFVELFSRDEYSADKIKDWISNYISSIETSHQLEKLISENNFISDLIKDYFTTNGYDRKLVENVISKFEINITRKNQYIHNQSEKQVSISKANSISLAKSNSDESAIKLGKSTSKALLGISSVRNVNYAAKNSTTNIYWCNPNEKVLNSDWYLILDNYPLRKVYLFKIPAKTFGVLDAENKGFYMSERNLILRSDAKNQDKIDLQIQYSDDSFTDTRSGIAFSPFLSAEVDY